MPRGDGTGPFGRGPFTGRGAGYCAGFVGPGFATSPAAERFAPGLGRGMGRGRGYRNRFYATGVPFRAYGPDAEPFLDAQEEATLLKSEAGRLRSVLESIEQRLEKLETT
jgi:hypothetical protein